MGCDDKKPNCWVNTEHILYIIQNRKKDMGYIDISNYMVKPQITFVYRSIKLQDGFIGY